MLHCKAWRGASVLSSFLRTSFLRFSFGGNEEVRKWAAEKWPVSAEIKQEKKTPQEEIFPGQRNRFSFVLKASLSPPSSAD